MRLKQVQFLSLLTTLLLFAISPAIASEKNKHNLIFSLHESLYSAIEMDRANEVEQFIEFGADIDHRYVDDKTPMMVAASKGSIKSVKILLELGADIKLVSKNNMTALDYARKNKHQPVMAALGGVKTPGLIPTRKQMISTIQLYLNRLGYIAGNLDGIYGIKTRKSLKQYSIDTNQNFSAEISNRQIEMLYNAMSNIETEKKSLHTDIQNSSYAKETIPSEIDNDLANSETTAKRSTR